MKETKIYADEFCTTFASTTEMLEFLAERAKQSKWIRKPTRMLKLVPLEKEAETIEEACEKELEGIVEDTEKNTQLVLKVNKDFYPVRDCAIDTILKRAGINGTGLKKLEKATYAKVVNYCLQVAKGDALIKVADGSIGILECKTCNYNAKDKWADDGIPENYVLQVRHYLAVMNMNKAYIACLYGNNENEFVYRCLERDRMEEEELIEQEKYFWEEYVEKKIEPPYSGKPDLILSSIRKYKGYADKSIPEISISSLESRSLEKYLKLSEEKSQLEKRKKEIEAEQRALSVPFVELLGQGCKAVIEDGSFRYRITYNPTIRTQIGKENMEKLKNQHPDIYEEYTSTTESRIFRIKKEVA